MEDKRTYRLDGQVLDIPSDKTAEFLKKYPDAEEMASFILEGDTIDIPIAKKDDFLTKYPEAKPTYDVKKKAESLYPTKEQSESQAILSGRSEKPFSVSKPAQQETPLQSNLPEGIGLSVENYKKLSEEARTATESTRVDVRRPDVDIQAQEESWWEQQKASWEQRKNQAAGIPYVPQTDEERRRIAETAYVPQETSSLEGLSDSEKRQVQFLETAASTSLIGKINMLYNPKLQKESSVILKDYNPTQLEETAAHVLGFVFDTPLFMTLGATSGTAGSYLSNSLYKGGVESVKHKLLSRGVDPIIAEAVAYKTGKSTLKGILGRVVERGTSSALTLGSYNMLSDAADQHLEALSRGESMDDYDWSRTLRSGGEGAALGLTIGVVGVPFEYAGSYVGRAIENTFTKSLAKGGVVAADIAAESIVLGSVSPIMEGRSPEMGDYLSGLTFVLLMKGSQLPQKRLMESVQSKMARRRDFTEDIPYTPREASQLGIRLDPKQASFDINKKGDKWLKSMAENREIPILTKMSVLYNEAGLRLNAFAEPASVKVKKEGEDYVVQTFVESKNVKDRFDLLAETVVKNKNEAEKMSLLGNLQIYDNKVKKVVDKMSPSQKGKLYDQIQLMKAEDSMLLTEAQDIPVRLRTPEQHRVVAEYYKMVQKAVDSQLIGDSPTASPIMRDAVSSTNGLSMVKPTTTHTISEPKEGVKKVEPTYSITVGGKTEKFTDKEKFLETLQVLEPNVVKVDITDDIQTADEVKTLLEKRRETEAAETIETTTEGEKMAQNGDKAPLTANEALKDKESLSIEPKTETDAIQVEEAKGVPTRQGAEVGQEVGQEVRGQEITQEKTLAAEAEQEGVTASFEIMESSFKKDLGKIVAEKKRETAIKTKYKDKIKDMKAAEAFVEKSWNEFKKANRATMKDMPQRIQNMMRDKAFKMTERNVDSTFEFFKNVMFNQKYADNLNKVGEKLETWKKQKFKGDIKETTEGLTEAQIRARHTYGSGEVKTFLNKMDITSPAITTRMVEKLNSALDDMMADKPTYTKIKEFIEEYQDVIENSIVESVTDVSMKEKDIERLVTRVEDFKGRFDKLKEKLEAGTVDVATLMEFQKNRRGYEAALRKFEEKLSLQDKNTIEETLETINEFFESGYSKMTQESIDIYEEALDKVNKEQVAKIRPAQLPNKYAQEVYDEILRVKELMLFEGNTLQEKETAKHRRMMLNPATVEMINHSIDEMESSGVIPRAFYSSIMDLHTALQAGDFFSLVESIRKGEHTQDGIFKLSPRTERVARKIATDENYLKGQYTTWMDSNLDLETPTDKPLERIFFSKMENAVIRAQVRATENTQGYTKALREAIGMKAKPLTSAKPSYKQQVTQARVGAVLYNLHYADMQEVVPKKRGEEFILKTKDGTEEVYDSYEKAYVEGNNNKGKYINLDFVGDAIRKDLHTKAKLSDNTALNNLRKQASVDAYNSFKTDNLEVTSMADVERLLKPAEVKLVKEIRKLLDDTKEQVRIMAHREGKDVKLFKENYFPTQIKEAIDNSVISENIMNLTKKASKGEPLEVSGTILPKQKTPTRWADIDVDRVIKSHITDVYLSYELYPIMKQEFKAMNMVQEKIKAMKKEGLDDGFMKLAEMERFVENFKQNRKDRYFTQMQSGKRIEGTYGVKLGNHFVNFTAALDNTAKVARTAVLADIMRPYLDFSPQILKQITERGWKIGTVKRLLEMRGMFEYLPEGSTMNTWMKEGLTRYGDPGFVWGDQGRAEEFLNNFMGVADRGSKPLGYIQKFDDVYKKLTGEEINAEQFFTNAEYRNERLRSPYFNQADVVASSYINSIHFARTQAALGAMFFNIMQPGTKRYAWMMPVMAYTSQQYKGFNISMGKLVEGQSKMGADTEAARVVGSVVNGTWYAMNRITVATLTALGLAAVAGRDDIVEEQWEKLKNVWSFEGTGTNIVGAVSGIYLSGGTAIATQLANIAIAALEVRERKVADDPVALKQVQDAREQLKTMVGVGYFNVGDLEDGKLGIRQVVNLLAPIVGSFAYELSVAAGETGMGIYEAFNDWKTVTPERKQELSGHVGRVSLYITALMLGGFPTLKDMRRFTQETVKMARKKPFDITMDTYIKNVDYVKLMDKYVREITNSPSYKMDEKGDIKYRIVDNGKAYPFRTIGEGEDEKAQVKKGLFWQDIQEGTTLQKKASALIKAEQAMETEVEITFDIGKGKDKKEMTYKGKYKDFYRGYKKNEGSWNVVTQLYKDISEEPSESLGLKQKLELFEKVKVEMAKTADAIFKDEYYEAVVANIMKDMKDMKKEFKTLEYDVRKDLFLDNLELN